VDRKEKLLTLTDGFNKKKYAHANNFGPKQIKDIYYVIQQKFP